MLEVLGYPVEHLAEDIGQPLETINKERNNLFGMPLKILNVTIKNDEITDSF
jgi:hypothetical protein